LLFRLRHKRTLLRRVGAGEPCHARNEAADQLIGDVVHLIYRRHEDYLPAEYQGARGGESSQGKESSTAVQA
jgi:hypothetical protein